MVPLVPGLNEGQQSQHVVRERQEVGDSILPYTPQREEVGGVRSEGAVTTPYLLV